MNRKDVDMNWFNIVTKEIKEGKKTIKEAANDMHFSINSNIIIKKQSISTFKRLCRDHGVRLYSVGRKGFKKN